MTTRGALPTAIIAFTNSQRTAWRAEHCTQNALDQLLRNGMLQPQDPSFAGRTLRRERRTRNLRRPNQLAQRGMLASRALHWRGPQALETTEVINAGARPPIHRENRDPTLNRQEMLFSKKICIEDQIIRRFRHSLEKRTTRRHSCARTCTHTHIHAPMRSHVHAHARTHARTHRK